MSSSSLAQPADIGALPSDAEGFAFLDGRWRVLHRKLKEPLTGRQEWIEFEGRASFSSLLDGLASVEDLRDADNAPIGGALRSFDRRQCVWADRWLPARSGLLQEPQYGRFEDGVGTFTSEEVHEGRPLRVRGIWRRINRDEVTWEQACSLDGGKTWELNWFMRFVRSE